MSLPVVVQPEAEDTLFQSAAWWAKHRSVDQAERWFDGFVATIYTLGDNPERHPVARENDKFPYEIRELNYGLGSHPTHRAVFTIRPDAVVVLTTRHLAQRDITLDDI